MNIEVARDIPGFTSEPELEWLAASASQRKMIAEIGCWRGRSARAMADNTSGTIYAVDTFDGTPGEHEAEFVNKPKGWLFEEFVQNNLEHVQDFGVVPFRGKSTELAHYFAHLSPMTFDMIFIDGAHDYESVKEDIAAWRPLLAPGGLLCGHDFDAGRPGVVQAVREAFPWCKTVGIGSLWTAK